MYNNYNSYYNSSMLICIKYPSDCMKFYSYSRYMSICDVITPVLAEFLAFQQQFFIFEIILLYSNCKISCNWLHSVDMRHRTIIINSGMLESIIKKKLYMQYMYIHIFTLIL